MLWSEVKRWAKDQGYDTLKDKGDEKKGDRIQYYWSKTTEPFSSGISLSVSKLARDIYNDITNNAWTQHQEDYKNSLDIQISTENL